MNPRLPLKDQKVIKMPLSLQHIHLVSQDKEKLAHWYCENLGFEITDDLEKMGEPDGPVLISADGGVTSISVFTRKRQIQNIFPAFSCTIDQFMEIRNRFASPRIYDHFRFFSFYVFDPDQNKIEVCVTEYETAKQHFQHTSTAYFPMNPETYSP